MNKKETETKNINFSNESIDLIRYTSINLRKNDYSNNDEIKNLEIVEKGLVDYSLLKLCDWGYNTDKLSDEDLKDLTSILKVMDNLMETGKDKRDFFIQYVHAVIYTLGKIKKQDEIKIKFTDLNSKYHIDGLKHDICPILEKEENGIIKEIQLDRNYKMYEMPQKILELFKALESYKQEKAPTYKK